MTYTETGAGGFYNFPTLPYKYLEWTVNSKLSAIPAAQGAGGMSDLLTQLNATAGELKLWIADLAGNDLIACPTNWGKKRNFSQQDLAKALHKSVDRCYKRVQPFCQKAATRTVLHRHKSWSFDRNILRLSSASSRRELKLALDQIFGIPSAARSDMANGNGLWDAFKNRAQCFKYTDKEIEELWCTATTAKPLLVRRSTY